MSANKISWRWLLSVPALAFIVGSIIFEAPATAYFSHAGEFHELLIVIGLIFLNVIIYYVIRKVEKKPSS